MKKIRIGTRTRESKHGGVQLNSLNEEEFFQWKKPFLGERLLFIWAQLIAAISPLKILV